MSKTSEAFSPIENVDEPKMYPVKVVSEQNKKLFKIRGIVETWEKTGMESSVAMRKISNILSDK